MALFEKRYTNKVLLDDTERLTSVIENARTIDGHTEYIIKTQRGPLPEKSWRVSRRYNDFVQLNAALSISGFDLSLPPKRIIGNMEPDFIAQRQIALQNYLNIVLMNPILASSLPMKKFLDPENYTAPLHEIALQQVSLALRSDANFEVCKPIPDMGWRLRKHYYVVKNRQNPKQELLLAWVEFGPDKHLQDKDIQGVFKTLGSLRHTYIEPIVHQHVTDNGALTIRNFYPAGTLRDVLCITKPKQPFIKKYGNPKQIKSLTVQEIATYGYQILEALGFLHEKGLPYGHLHTGNVLLTPRCAKLLDIENGLLGLPAFYRPYVVQRRKLHATTQVDVYSFGHVLYEMAFGRPLLEATCSDLSHCEANLKNLLEVILSPEALKQDLPTVIRLLEHPFFESARRAALAIGTVEKPYFKLSNHLKEALQEAVNKAEQRLRDEQKVARHQKRLVKVQEMMSSEEEMKKRKHKLKKEQKLAQEQRSSSQLGTNGTKQINGKSPERSDSPTSTSTATSVGTLTPPSLPGHKS
ncbi:PX domain-containing protein kinase-like protein isoform X2 [Pogonomyrmex barbatus]|uniref:PX domain-containing protein kinase-like protein n=1 Tax=Pogonomyrmex barbatus TaxID=144034 RepID=A0A6I9X0W0_9HYME|nr:PX domain-containing protein kinase-like protein isoform X2 [Pogonomyrmex barbatus]XP_011646172.1 PX domain-containing protein kinase-like protein isoform X2 [Pogonomyrmex barbatus]XP_011646173.1 PX domain-containing protein kinase-like protein isoform X2 [Pogonomyrmex barbatus]